jgi:exonuclease SbcD
MSVAGIDYHHGVDLITIQSDGKHQVTLLEYQPQHKLIILPKEDEELTPKKLLKLIDAELDDRVDGKLNDQFVYVMLKVKLEKVNNDDIVALEEKISEKNAVLSRIQRIIPELDLTTISGAEHIHSVDDIINRNPLDTLIEAYAVKYKVEMSEHQEQMLKDLLQSITSESDNA